MSPSDQVPAPATARGVRHAGRRAAIALVLGVAAAIGWVWWSETAPTRAIARMEPAARRAEYMRISEELRALCSPPDPALAEHCRHQARFLVRFPECDAACESLARRAMPVESTR
jgi:cytochrome b pre-mRNA-processing protein 3